MSKNHFYEKKGPFPLIEIIKGINLLRLGNNPVKIDASDIYKIISV